MKKNRVITIVTIILTIGLLSGLYASVVAVNGWFETHRLVFASPVVLTLNKPIRVEGKEPEVIIQPFIVSYPGEVDTPIKQYICDKFGPYDCKVALAIVDAESNFNELAIGINGTSVDLGCWQINFPTHKGTISPKDAFDCKKSTDWAYEKYKRDGNFNAWVTFTKGTFKNHL